ncbi:hypothetical protein Ddc_01255 [Ditylenchus destructor]|nr:hypothetical protein Ddc_01255 [Ditylenchus destructor]
MRGSWLCLCVKCSRFINKYISIALFLGQALNSVNPNINGKVRNSQDEFLMSIKNVTVTQLLSLNDFATYPIYPITFSREYMSCNTSTEGFGARVPLKALICVVTLESSLVDGNIAAVTMFLYISFITVTITAAAAMVVFTLH